MRNFPVAFSWLLFHVLLMGTTIHGKIFDSDEVTRVLQSSLDCRKTPGMAVSVVKDGKTLYSKGFGVTDKESKTPVTDDTLFSIASISKSFAAALLVKLIDKRTDLTLNSKVRDYLKDSFRMPDEWRTQEMTFLDLLSHKTAMLSNNRIRYDVTFNRDTLLQRLALLPSNKQFRVDYIYNNLIYGLVGRLAEKMGGKRWEDLVAEHFFQPLRMTKSTFVTRVNFSRSDLARGYSERDGPDMPELVSPELSRRWGEICASGAVMSSANEMTKYLNFHLSGGKNSLNDTVMDPELVQELHKGRFAITPLKYLDITKPTFPITSDTNLYALGLRVGTYRGYPFITHTGTTFGYAAYMALLPTQKIGSIVLINNSDRYFRQRGAVQHYLLDSALGIEPYIDNKTVCSYPSPWITKELKSTYRPKRSNVPLKFPTIEYEGVYDHVAFGKLEIVYNATLDSPTMTYGWGNWEFLVWPTTNSSSSNDQEQRMYAKGVAPVYPSDLQPMYFIAHPNDSNVIVGLKAYGFEKKRPPIFCKEKHSEVCLEIETKTYPREPVKMPCASSTSISKNGHLYSVLMVFFVVFYRNF